GRRPGPLGRRRPRRQPRRPHLPRRRRRPPPRSTARSLGHVVEPTHGRLLAWGAWGHPLPAGEFAAAAPLPTQVGGDARLGELKEEAAASGGRRGTFAQTRIASHRPTNNGANEAGNKKADRGSALRKSRPWVGSTEKADPRVGFPGILVGETGFEPATSTSRT